MNRIVTFIVLCLPLLLAVCSTAIAIVKVDGWSTSHRPMKAHLNFWHSYGDLGFDLNTHYEMVFPDLQDGGSRIERRSISQVIGRYPQFGIMESPPDGKWIIFTIPSWLAIMLGLIPPSVNIFLNRKRRRC